MNVAIVIPPFAAVERPSLAGHILQACLIGAGFSATVVYANLRYAKIIGDENYQKISYSPRQDAWGERLFCRAAFGVQKFGRLGVENLKRLNSWTKGLIQIEDLGSFEAVAAPFMDELASELIGKKYDVVGATSTFDQTCSGIALLHRIKKKCPSILTVMGGANCHGEMAEGIAELCSEIDFVFSGEGETAFPELLLDLKHGEIMSKRIVHAKTPTNLNMIPTLNYRDYYEQLEIEMAGSQLIRNGKTSIPYETSRGCWWGEKQQCTFCGFNGANHSYRVKDPDRALAEISGLLKKHPGRKVMMVDTIIPPSYFDSFLPRVKLDIGNIHIYYEIRSNESYAHLKALKEAGASNLQPGIEALSSGLLKRMRKGVLLRHNLAFLRNALTLGIETRWNLLVGFPDDTDSEYAQTMEIMKKIPHFPAPRSMHSISIDRHSTYQTQPEKYGIKNLKPWKWYFDVFPPNFDVSTIAVRFEGIYDSFIMQNPPTMQRLCDLVNDWQTCWRRPPHKRPQLRMAQVDEKRWELVDTRECRNEECVGISIGNEQSELLSRDWPLARITGNIHIQWALENDYMVITDGYLVSLVERADVANTQP